MGPNAGVPLNLFLPLLAIPLFLLLFALIGRVVLAKYKALAERYPFSAARSEPERWIVISPDFGLTEGTRNGFFFSADSAGFYLKPIWLLRWGNPPAFVPWEMVSVEATRSLKVFRSVDFQFTGLPEIRMRLFQRDWQRALKVFPEAWPEKLRNVSWD
jgi:hypothetical protein